MVAYGTSSATFRCVNGVAELAGLVVGSGWSHDSGEDREFSGSEGKISFERTDGSDVKLEMRVRCDGGRITTSVELDD